MRRVVSPAVMSTRIALHLCASSTGASSGSTRATMNFGIDQGALELKLDFANMDLAAMVDATQEALGKPTPPRSGGRSNEDILDSQLASLYENSHRDASVADSNGGDVARSKRPSGFGGGGELLRARTIRGVVDAGTVHDVNTPAAVYAQRRREQADQGRLQYTLMDLLRDCALSGNWRKAYERFEQAVVAACKVALVPAASTAPAYDSADSREDGLCSNSADALQVHALGSPKVNACLDVLKKQNSSLPPNGAGQHGSAHAFRKDLVGILRWGNGHYYMLLKALVEADRTAETRVVWDVMNRIGVVEHHLDARTVNTLMSLMRRSNSVEAAQLAETVMHANRKSDTDIPDGKALKRQIIGDLEKLSQRKNMRLSGSSQRTAEAARVAEAMHRGSDDEASAAAKKNLRVGDFNGLLRVAQSVESTERVLSMMNKLSVPIVACTYASIIASVHSPRYRLPDATDAEIAAATRFTRADAQFGEGEEDRSAESHTPESKAAYEAYKEKRIRFARGWFDRCAPADRTADLYNEMLYLLRAKVNATAFDSLLSEFRGNCVRSPSDRECVERHNAAISAGAASPTPGAEAPEVPEVPAIMPPTWTVPPNGRTFELLINRERYFHDWQAVWDLHAEMRPAGVRGTRRTYETLLEQSRTHPPTSIRSSGDVSAFIMALYDEMRQTGADVNSVRSTVNLVNAWSSTRKTRRWN